MTCDRAPKSSTDAGSTTENAPDPQAGQTQTSTRPDGTPQTQVVDAQGNLTNQGGEGQLAATYGYDTAGTGSLTSLTTYGSATGTTGWAYDPSTGQLQSKQYADLTKDTYSYNDKGQLASLAEPGVSGTFGYDAVGDQLRASYFDSVTGLVQSTVAQQDDQGRPVITVDTDNGKTFTTADAYTSVGDLQSETFGSAGNATVAYGYYAPSGDPQNGSADALQTMTIATLAGQTAQQGYTYEPGGKRLQTITVNGITITYAYVPDSNQLQSITVGNVTTFFTPDAADPSRLGSMSVTAGGQTVYDATYGYNQLDQRTSDAVTTTTVDDSGNTSSVDASRGYTYDPNQADALVSVQDASGSTIESYGSDGAGNLVDFNGDVRTPNNVNQLSGYAFNARGDATATASYNLTWDALDRPIQIQPKTPVLGSYEIQLGYDSQNRWLWKDVYQWDGSQYVYAYSRKAVWDGSQLVAELDQNGSFVKQYTWGPNGLALITDYSSGAAKSYVPVADASGNVVMVIDPLTGAVVASYTYDAYGNLKSASGPMKDLCPFLGKGLYVHAEVPGLMFAENRVTDGRIWLSRDPSGEGGGLNLYQLYGGDPINDSDLTGLAVTPAQSTSEIGYVYTITGTDPQSGQPVTYTGSAADILVRMGSHKGTLKALINAKPTRIVVKKVSGSPDVAASGRQTGRSALNEALRSQEQPTLQQNGGVGSPGSLNQRNAATPSNMTKWQDVHGTSVSDDAVVLKEAGEALPAEVPGTLTLNSLLPLLQIAETAFVQARDENAGIPIKAPFVYHDDGGDFTVSESYGYFLAGLIKYNHTYAKTYKNGPRAGQIQSIDSDAFEKYKAEGKQRWGYISFWGNFVPGTERSSIPLFDEYGKLVGYADKDGKHFYPRVGGRLMVPDA